MREEAALLRPPGCWLLVLQPIGSTGILFSPLELWLLLDAGRRLPSPSCFFAPPAHQLNTTRVVGDHRQEGCGDKKENLKILNRKYFWNKVVAAAVPFLSSCGI